jgi:O-antigen biosynthesis protein
MKISIFTPTHKSKYLIDAYESIKDQEFDEWVVVHNNGSEPIGFDDERVKEIKVDIESSNVGMYKRIACENCTGDILVELDHDDLLTPNAIKEICKAFEDDEVGFVYSNPLISRMDGGKQERFLAEHGWEYRRTNFQGKLLDQPIAFEPTPASVSKIWYAPDHVRAFRKNVYEEAGGYDAGLEILDDQDLMCRMYQITKFHHIDKPLYVYRIHGENTWLEKNQKIQDGVLPLYDKYIESMTLKWAEGLLKIDLGGRLNGHLGYTSVDLKAAEINCDLNGEWPFEDGSVGVVRAFDVFEHLKDPLHTMKELYRVLAPGGYAFIQVPSTDGRGAFQDPTHVSFWNENSFLYYTDQSWAQYIDTPVRFQAMRLYTTAKNEQQVCWTVAHLVKVADGLPGVIKI